MDSTPDPQDSLALELLESGGDPQAAEHEPRIEDPTVLRDSLAALTALAYDPPAVEPSPGLRAAILERARALGPSRPTATEAGSAASDETLLPFRTVERFGSLDEPADLTLHRLPDRARELDRSRGGRAWQTLVAAAVLLGVLGLGYLAGAVQTTLQSTRDDVGVLRTELSTTRAELESARERFEMVTATARQAYPMMVRGASDPAGPSERAVRGEAENAKGIVYVCGNHQQWLLSLTGLQQPPPGELYRLWFMTEDGPVDGGVLEVDQHGDAAAEDLSMPPGTRGFSVSLEPAGEPVEAPHRVILLGDEPVRL